MNKKYLMKPSIGSGILSNPLAARKDFVLLPRATKIPNTARSLSKTCNVAFKKRNKLTYLNNFRLGAPMFHLNIYDIEN